MNTTKPLSTSGGKLKILFLGTSEFAVPILRALLNAGHEVAAVVTVPDQSMGRKKILTPSPVKVLARQYNLPIFQPEKLRGNNDLLLQLSRFNLDIGVTAAYGKIIPQELLDLPKLGIINIHPSLLPKYRGPSPIQTALLNGDTETGVTILQVDSQIDHGSTIATCDVAIIDSDTYSSLETKLAKIGAELLIEVLPKYISEELRLQVQDESQATFTRMIKTEDGEIKPTDTVEQALNKIRALNPEPGTYLVTSNWSLVTGKEKIRIRIFEADKIEQESASWLTIKLQDGYLLLKKVQPAGGKVMSGADWLRGQK